MIGHPLSDQDVQTISAPMPWRLDCQKAAADYGRHMIYPIMGLQSPLLLWCSAVMTELIGGSSAGSPAFHADTAEQLLRGWMTRARPFVVTASRPDGVLRRSIRETQRPFVMAAASAKVAVDHLVCRHGINPLDAVRGVLGDLATLVELANAERRITVTSTDVAKTPKETILRLAAHFRLPGEEGLASLIAQRCETLTADSATTVLQDPDERLSVDAALAGTNDALVAGVLNRVVVTRHFFTTDAGGKAPVGPVDATGRHRLLIYGPFIALPKGDWTARCVYSFSEGIVGTSMSVDIIHFAGGFRELARTSFVVTSAGRLDVNVRFTHDEPAAAVEVRLFSDGAIFDGTVSLGFVEFRRNATEQDNLLEIQHLLEEA